MSWVLLVDDEAAMATLVGMTLEGTGVELIRASNLTEARAQILERKPDLILLDLVLGTEDGMDLLNEDSRHLVDGIPVIVFSIHDSRFSEAIGLGASAFLTKPFRRVDLLATIRKYVSSPWV